MVVWTRGRMPDKHMEAIARSSGKWSAQDAVSLSIKEQPAMSAIRRRRRRERRKRKMPGVSKCRWCPLM